MRRRMLTETDGASSRSVRQKMQGERAASERRIDGVDGMRAPWTRFLTWEPLRAIGVASFGAYVFHLPTLKFITLVSGLSSSGALPERLALFAIAYPLAIGASFVSYRWFESRFHLAAGAGLERFPARRRVLEHRQRMKAD